MSRDAFLKAIVSGSKSFNQFRAGHHGEIDLSGSEWRSRSDVYSGPDIMLLDNETAESPPEVGIDGAVAFIYKDSYKGYNFSNLNFDSAVLIGISFEKCNFSGSKFPDCILEGIDFIACVFENCTFHAAEFEDVDFGGSDFSNASFNGALFDHVSTALSDFSSADLRNIDGLEHNHLHSAYGNSRTALSPDFSRPSDWLTGEEQIENARESARDESIQIRASLRNSALRLSLSDFDITDGQIRAVPFRSDSAQFKEMNSREPARELLETIRSACSDLTDLYSDNNFPDRERQFLTDYQSQIVRTAPNPRILEWKASAVRDFFEDEASPGLKRSDQKRFSRFFALNDELLAHYFRANLERAQKIGLLRDISRSSIDQASHLLTEAQSAIANHENSSNPVVDDSIKILLRQIDQEVKDTGHLKYSPEYLENPTKIDRDIQRAVKEGALFVGRFLFFGGLVTIGAYSPNALSNMASLASLLGLFEAAQPGTIRKIYEDFRSLLPDLPKFPET